MGLRSSPHIMSCLESEDSKQLKGIYVCTANLYRIHKLFGERGYRNALLRAGAIAEHLHIEVSILAGGWLIVLYFIVVVLAFAFQMVFQITEGKDERGQQILGYAMSLTFPMIIMGIAVLEMVDHLSGLSKAQYHFWVILIISLTCIIQSIVIWNRHLKK